MEAAVDPRARDTLRQVAMPLPSSIFTYQPLLTPHLRSELDAKSRYLGIQIEKSSHYNLFSV